MFASSALYLFFHRFQTVCLLFSQCIFPTSISSPSFFHGPYRPEDVQVCSKFLTASFAHDDLASGFPSLLDATIEELARLLDAGSLTGVELVAVTGQHS